MQICKSSHRAEHDFVQYTETILQIAPDRIVYVSCDPATLAWDLKKLAEGGYASLNYAQPVDQLAHTVHVETAVLMSRIQV